VSVSSGIGAVSCAGAGLASVALPRTFVPTAGPARSTASVARFRRGLSRTSSGTSLADGTLRSARARLRGFSSGEMSGELSGDGG